MNDLFFILFLFAEESARGLISAPGQTVVEPTIINFVSWIRLFIEIAGAGIVAVGVCLAVYKFARVHFSPDDKNYTQIRLLLAKYLALALEFQLGADIISTAIAPSWNQIGKLAVIAIIRTALNYFLSREMARERRKTDEDRSASPTQ